METEESQETKGSNRFADYALDQLLEQEKQSVIDLALSVLDENLAIHDISMCGSSEVKSYVRLKMKDYKREVFAVLFLNNKSRLIEYEELFYGTVDSCFVYPRIVAQRSLKLNASAVVLAHNHPSGSSEPSQADIDITKTIKDILQVLDVRTLDHIIVGSKEVVSMREKGLV